MKRSERWKTGNRLSRERCPGKKEKEERSNGLEKTRARSEGEKIRED